MVLLAMMTLIKNHQHIVANIGKSSPETVQEHLGNHYDNLGLSDFLS